MLSQRTKLLKYLRRKDPEKYFTTIAKLGLKDRPFSEPNFAWPRQKSAEDRSQRDVQRIRIEPSVQPRHGLFDASLELFQRLGRHLERVDEGRTGCAAAVVGGATSVLGGVEPVMGILGFVHHALHLVFLVRVDVLVQALAVIEWHGVLADPLLQRSALVDHQIQVLHVDCIFSLLQIVRHLIADVQELLQLRRRETHAVLQCCHRGLGPQTAWILRRKSLTGRLQTRLEIHQRTRQSFVGERQDAVPSHHVPMRTHGASWRAFHLRTKHGPPPPTRPSRHQAASTCDVGACATTKAFLIQRNQLWSGGKANFVRVARKDAPNRDGSNKWRSGEQAGDGSALVRTDRCLGLATAVHVLHRCVVPFRVGETGAL
eukprot:scaffold1822_cov333-Pavlova_lutheri.AAC.19